MLTVTDPLALQRLCIQWETEGKDIALVPTMGFLHAGHESLIRKGRELADKLIVSVFVNPTQFGPNEDFTRYPRTPDADTAGLAAAGCDALWLPDVESMYPFGVELAAKVQVPGVSAVLEGAFRPGHFDGVCTVVSRLFNQVLPDVAVFGNKDYQQLAVIRQMVADLQFPIDIVGGEIVREANGLAMSSRNQYLSAEQREVAATIHRTLVAMREATLAAVPRAQVEADAARRLGDAGFEPDYAVLRNPDLSEPVDGQAGERVALIAARLGKTRLIDNLTFDLPASS